MLYTLGNVSSQDAHLRLFFDLEQARLAAWEGAIVRAIAVRYDWLGGRLIPRRPLPMGLDPDWTVRAEFDGRCVVVSRETIPAVLFVV